MSARPIIWADCKYARKSIILPSKMQINEYNSNRQQRPRIKATIDSFVCIPENVFLANANLIRAKGREGRGHTMKNMNRREFLGTAGAFAGIMALAGCGSTGGNTASTTTAASPAAASGDMQLLTAGKLTVGTSPDFPPFENLENDEYVGLDMDLAKALADKLGLELELKNLQFDAIVPAVAAGGQVDLGISGITIEPEREEQVDFSDPYYIDDLAVVAMKDNADVTVDTYADALNQAGVVIAVQSGTTGESYAQENFPSPRPSPTATPPTASPRCSPARPTPSSRTRPWAPRWSPTPTPTRRSSRRSPRARSTASLSTRTTAACSLPSTTPWPSSRATGPSTSSPTSTLARIA